MNKVNLSNGEDTEVFVFTKRKRESGMIDLTGEGSNSKKRKFEVDLATPKELSVECAQADCEVEVLKYIPGDGLAVKVQSLSPVAALKIHNGNDTRSGDVVINSPKLFSPPPVTRLTSATYVKSKNIIDLTKSSSPDRARENKLQVIVEEDEDLQKVSDLNDIPQNQLEDENCR